MKVFKFFVLFCLIAFGCKQNNEPFDKEKTISEILNMFDNYHNAIKVSGLQAEFDYLDKSSDFFWVPPGYSSTLSYDSIKQILTTNSKTIKSIEFSFDTIQIFPLNKKIANYSGIVTGKMADTANIITSFKIIESGTLIKRNNGWKLLNGQSRNIPSN